MIWAYASMPFLKVSINVNRPVSWLSCCFHWSPPQDTGTLEKHSFATSTFTQFCILFKRTFITICRDTVNKEQIDPCCLSFAFRLPTFMFIMSLSLLFPRCWPTSGWCPTCVLGCWLVCSIWKLGMMPVRSSTTLASSFSPCCSWCLLPSCPPS